MAEEAVSWLVTPEMRAEHFDAVGYMVKDSEILLWFKEHKNESKNK